MHSYPLFVHTDPLGDALKLVYNSPSAAYATATLSIGLYSPDLLNLNQLDEASFTALVAVCPNLRVLYLRKWDFKSVQPRLFSPVSLSRLTSLSIGRGSTLTAAGLFGLLSMTPVLKRLGIGRVDCYDGSFPSAKLARAHSDSEEYRAIPACSLTHLAVRDDQSTSFTAYAHLLSRSRDTLAHFEMHVVSGEWVADAAAAALARCTRVRHLTLLANDLSHARIIAACPTLRSLTLPHVPDDGELAAMRAPLRALEVINYYDDPEAEFLEDAWERLRKRLPTPPLRLLSSIRFSSMPGSRAPKTAGVQRMLRACRARRIRVSLCREMSGVHGLDL